ncbi:hypothetical protein NL676_030840 [Syzygium grande]|nr:hypothetical protein NL676_030840 [Syzygium grande]
MTSSGGGGDGDNPFKSSRGKGRDGSRRVARWMRPHGAEMVAACLLGLRLSTRACAHVRPCHRCTAPILS